MNERRGLLLFPTLLAILTAMPSVTWADDYTNPGAFLTLAGLTAFPRFYDVGGTDFGTSFGFELRGGYRFNKYLEAEVDAEFLSGFDARVDVAPSGQLDVPATLDGGNVTLNGKIYLPFGRFQPYGLVGAGGMWARLRTSGDPEDLCPPGFDSWCSGVYRTVATKGGYVMKFGGGIDVYLTDDFAITVDAAYVAPFGTITRLRYVNLGWGARFNF